MIESIIRDLIDHGCIKTGDFTLKSGKKSNVYLDLREVFSIPELRSKIVQELCKKGQELDRNISDYLSGIPTSGQIFASQMSQITKQPLLVLRKQPKKHGLGKMIEGKYKADNIVTLIDDVLTTGTSAKEALIHLRKEGLIVEDLIVICDRSTGKDALHNIEIELDLCITSLFTLDDVQRILKNKPLTLTQKLQDVTEQKQSRLIVSADLTTTDEILGLASQVGPYIVGLKLHSDIIIDFTDIFIKHLRCIAQKYNFLLIADRKFSDIGSTVQKQFNGSHQISSWADIVTVHSIAGPGTIQALTEVRNDIGIIVVTDLSCSGSLTDNDYYLKSRLMMEGFCCKNIIGIVSQLSKHVLNVWPINYSLFTPGVSLSLTGDNLNQKYRSIKDVRRNGTDYIIVGRSIYNSNDIIETTKAYQERSFQPL